MINPLVSIVIPIFNRERTISTCIESVLKVNYDNFELILIDDGSTDSTRSICQHYVDQYSNVILFCQENKGVSAARNKGIELAKGKWITFLDSDDAFLPSHMEIVRKESTNADLLMVGSCVATKEEDHISPIGEVQTNKRVYNDNVAAYLMSKKFDPFVNMFYSVWDKFFRLEIIKSKNIYFDETVSLGEDQIFVCDYLCHATTFVYYSESSYARLNWNNIEHLGFKLRTPEEYLYNQKKNFQALMRLYKTKGGELTKLYAINYAIDRPITRIIYKYAMGDWGNCISIKDFTYFVNIELKPFLCCLNREEYNAICWDVRISRWLLIHCNLNVTLQWAKFYLKCIYPFVKNINIFLYQLKGILRKILV